MVEAVPPKEQVLESVEVRAPLKLGFPLTVTVQFADAARLLVLQLSTVMVKSAELLSAGALHPVAETPPEFANVKT